MEQSIPAWITVGPMPEDVQPSDIEDTLCKIARDAGVSKETARAVARAVVMAIGRSDRRATVPTANLEQAWPAFVALSESYALMSTELLLAYVAAHRAGVQLDSIHPEAGKATLSPLN